jgi:hypothetical protein
MLVLRVFSACFTRGTDDTNIWTLHVTHVERMGITAYYKDSRGSVIVFNHPPLIGLAMTGLKKASDVMGVEFRFLYRLILGASDYVSAWLLFRLLAGSPWRHAVCACYLAAPAVWILSAYHGNTDSLLGLAAIGAAYSFARERYGAAAVWLGAGVSVKWIILIIAPYILFRLPDWVTRVRFSLIFAVVIVGSFGYHITEEATALVQSVALYGGQEFRNGHGEPIWGNRIILGPILLSLLGEAPATEAIAWLATKNGEVLIVVIFGYSFLRARFTTAHTWGRGFGELFVLFHAATNSWAYQYLAWGLPCWFLLKRWQALGVVAVSSSYLYLLYSYLCDSPLLLGPWEVGPRNLWPNWLRILRTGGVAIFVIVGTSCFLHAAREAVTTLCIKRRVRREGGNPKPGNPQGSDLPTGPGSPLL